jgi:N4-gp56 family major capsid protein
MTAFTTALTGTSQVDNSLITQYDQLFLLEAQQGLVIDQLATVRKSINGVGVQFPRFSALQAGGALTETEDPASVALSDQLVTILPTAFGNVTSITELAMLQSGGIVDRAAIALVGQDAAYVKNLQATLALSASTNVLTAGGKATGSIAAGDVLDKATIVKTYAKLKSAFAGKLGQDYALVLHPHVIADLKLASTAGSWEDVNKYAGPAEGIFNGEVGRWQGFRIIENSACKVTADGGAGSTVDLYESYAVGLNGLGLGITQDIQFVMTQNDKLNRFTHIGWKGVFGYKIVEPTAVVKIITASSLGANA